jgi:hypothetical protein
MATSGEGATPLGPGNDFRPVGILWRRDMAQYLYSVYALSTTAANNNV